MEDTWASLLRIPSAIDILLFVVAFVLRLLSVFLLLRTAVGDGVNRAVAKQNDNVIAEIRVVLRCVMLRYFLQ